MQQQCIGKSTSQIMCKISEIPYFHHSKPLSRIQTSLLCCSNFASISFQHGGLKCLKLTLFFFLALSVSRSLDLDVDFFNYSLLALYITNERLKGIIWKALMKYIYFLFLFFSHGKTLEDEDSNSPLWLLLLLWAVQVCLGVWQTVWVHVN